MPNISFQYFLTHLKLEKVFITLWKEVVLKLSACVYAQGLEGDEKFEQFYH